MRYKCFFCGDDNVVEVGLMRGYTSCQRCWYIIAGIITRTIEGDRSLRESETKRITEHRPAQLSISKDGVVFATADVNTTDLRMMIHEGEFGFWVLEVLTKELLAAVDKGKVVLDD